MNALSGLGALIIAAGTALMSPLPASASCAGTPPPAKAVFTGTVTATDHNGRRATVTTDDGRTVTVVGTPELDAAATSVDRSFEVGGRYEFHALNDASPFEDNACTLTKKIGSGSVPSGTSWALPAAGGMAAVIVAGIVVTMILRRRTATRVAGGASN